MRLSSSYRQHVLIATGCYLNVLMVAAQLLDALLQVCTLVLPLIFL